MCNGAKRKRTSTFGGRHNAQFNDALKILRTKGLCSITIGILDGVLSVQGGGKTYQPLTNAPEYGYHDSHISLAEPRIPAQSISAQETPIQERVSL
jgi:hypothetical protein